MPSGRKTRGQLQSHVFFREQYVVQQTRVSHSPEMSGLVEDLSTLFARQPNGVDGPPMDVSLLLGLQDLAARFAGEFALESKRFCHQF